MIEQLKERILRELRKYKSDTVLDVCILLTRQVDATRFDILYTMVYNTEYHHVFYVNDSDDPEHIEDKLAVIYLDLKKAGMYERRNKETTGSTTKNARKSKTSDR